MKRISFIIMAAVLTAAAGCASDKDRGDDPKGQGSVMLDCSVAGTVGVVTRADARDLPTDYVPDADDLKLVISNGDGEVAVYDKMSDYDAPLLYVGDYTFEFTYGDPDTEGIDAPYYYGSETFKIISRTEIIHDVTAKLANSVYSLKLGDWFRGYYADYQLTVTTESGHTATYEGSTDDPLAEETDPVFIKAGTKLYLSGTATKTNGAEVAFQNTQIGTSTACTWHTIVVNIDSIGDAQIEITLDDSTIPVPVEEIELNPDADEN